MQQQQWRQARHHLYEHLVHSCDDGFDLDLIQQTRDCFDSNGTQFTLRPITLDAHDAVSLICVRLPLDLAQECRRIAESVVAIFPNNAHHDVAYLNETETMHLTLFHTSRPDELVPNARERQPQDLATVQDMARKLQPIAIKPFRVVLCGSGALILLYSPVTAAPDAPDEFVVDKIRTMAELTFEPYPKRQARAILHTSLVRILDPDVCREMDVAVIRKRCEELTAELNQKFPDPIVLRTLSFVDEQAEYSADGPTTLIALGSCKAVPRSN